MTNPFGRLRVRNVLLQILFLEVAILFLLVATHFTTISWSKSLYHPPTCNPTFASFHNTSLCVFLTPFFSWLYFHRCAQLQRHVCIQYYGHHSWYTGHLCCIYCYWSSGWKCRQECGRTCAKRYSKNLNCF